jgi:predicted sulfurtransferase
MNRRGKRSGLVLAILVVGVLALAGCGSEVPQTKDQVPRISPREVQNRIDGGEPILIVDSRSADSYAKSHIAGAISVPLNEVESRLAELPRDQEIVFYCT